MQQETRRRRRRHSGRNSVTYLGYDSNTFSCSSTKYAISHHFIMNPFTRESGMYCGYGRGTAYFDSNSLRPYNVSSTLLLAYNIVPSAYLFNIIDYCASALIELLHSLTSTPNYCQR